MALAALLLGLLYPPLLGGSGDCRPKLTPVKQVRTAGSAGWEHFEAGGEHFLITANFWDGKSRDMSADSEVFAVSADAGVLGGLSLQSVQKIAGKGAHGADVFTAHGELLLVVPSYYGCGQKRQPGAPSGWPCKSTEVLAWRAPARRFERIAQLPTHGPAQTDHLTRGGETFIVIGENFANALTVWRIDKDGPSLRFVPLPELTMPVAGGGSMAVFGGGGDGGERGELIIAATSYHDPRTGWSTRTPVFTLEGGRAQQSQALPSLGPHVRTPPPLILVP